MSAWREIERLAEGLVEKEREGLTKEQAVDRVLQTPQGHALYARYLQEGDDPVASTRTGADIQREAERRQQVLAGRELLEHGGYVMKSEPAQEVSNGATADAIWSAIEKSAEGIVAKSSAPLSQAQGVDRFLKSDRGKRMYAAYTEAKTRADMGRDFSFAGVSDPRAQVRKADAMAEIEERARALSEHDPSLTYERAVSTVLDRHPELYAAYATASAAGARDRDGRDIGERASASVSKSEPVQLSKAAEEFLKSFEAWMDGDGPRPWPAETERVLKSEKDDDAEFEQRLEGVLKEASRRGYRIGGDVYDPDDFEL